jgi:hypothetical protein
MKIFNQSWYSLILIFGIFIILTATLMAAALSGPASPTVNSIPTYSNNKQLTNTGLIIDANSNIYNINGLTGQVMNLVTVRTTNFYIGSNSLASWPIAPEHYGDAYFGNSNGVIFLLTSTNISSLAWTKTNWIAP